MAKKQKAGEDVLNVLHAAVAEHLVSRLKTGEITPAELGHAIKFLKDNGIEATLENEEMMALAHISLPKFEEDDIGPFN